MRSEINAVEGELGLNAASIVYRAVYLVYEPINQVYKYEEQFQIEAPIRLRFRSLGDNVGYYLHFQV